MYMFHFKVTRLLRWSGRHTDHRLGQSVQHVHTCFSDPVGQGAVLRPRGPRSHLPWSPLWSVMVVATAMAPFVVQLLCRIATSTHSVWRGHGEELSVVDGLLARNASAGDAGDKK